MTAITVQRPPAAQGLAWVKQGWGLFAGAALPWSGMTALVFLVLLGVGVVPHLGGMLVHVLSPFIVAGFMAACRDAQQGQPVTFMYLAAGFRQARQPLLVMGLIYMVATLLIFQLVGLLAGIDMRELMAHMERPQEMTPEQAEALLQGFMPALLLGSVLMLPLLMASWFAPALIHFEAFAPVRALWWSLWACAVNWRPFAVCGMLLAMLGMVALLIPFGLGLLIFVPWSLTTTYAAYQDIFRAQPEEALAT